MAVIGRPYVCLLMRHNGTSHPNKDYNLGNMFLWLTQHYQIIIFFLRILLLGSTCTISLLRRCELVVVVWPFLSYSAVYHCALDCWVSSPQHQE